MSCSLGEHPAKQLGGLGGLRAPVTRGGVGVAQLTAAWLADVVSESLFSGLFANLTCPKSMTNVRQYVNSVFNLADRGGETFPTCVHWECRECKAKNHLLFGELFKKKHKWNNEKKKQTEYLQAKDEWKDALQLRRIIYSHAKKKKQVVSHF